MNLGGWIIFILFWIACLYVVSKVGAVLAELLMHQIRSKPHKHGDEVHHCSTCDHWYSGTECPDCRRFEELK